MRSRTTADRPHGAKEKVRRVEVTSHHAGESPADRRRRDRPLTDLESERFAHVEVDVLKVTVLRASIAIVARALEINSPAL